MVIIEKCNYSQFVCLKGLFDAFQLLIEFDTQLWNFDYKRLLHKAYVNGVILRGQNLSKLPVSWAESVLTTWSRSLQRGNVSPLNFEGDEIVWYSNLGHTCVVWLWQGGRTFFRPPNWQLVTLQPFNLQRPTVPLWKDLELIVNINSD